MLYEVTTKTPIDFAAIVEKLGEKRLYQQSEYIGIDMGDYGYTHEDAPGSIWGGDEYLRSHLSHYAKMYEKPFLASGIGHVDTRPAIKEVVRLINLVETEIYAQENPDCDYLEYVRSGVWDEGLGVAPGVEGGNAWWLECWVAVYVVHGGSEGYWLHVDGMANDKPPQRMLLGKALGSSWEECWKSAGRIARMIGA